MTYVLAWTSGREPGHEQPRTVYYCETEGGYWNGLYDRRKAKRFETSQAALDLWRSLHGYAEKYEECIKKGSVRAELIDEPELCL